MEVSDSEDERESAPKPPGEADAGIDPNPNRISTLATTKVNCYSFYPSYDTLTCITDPYAGRLCITE